MRIPIAVSARHAHLSRPTLLRLFGDRFELHVHSWLLQTGQFSAQETVSLVGPHGRLDHVRLMGPPRQRDQIELSRSDECMLGIAAPLRISGDVDRTPGLQISGPAGSVTLSGGSRQWQLCRVGHARYFNHRPVSSTSHRERLSGKALARRHRPIRGATMNKRPWKTLLVVIADPFAKDQPALTKAVALSLRSGARLVLFNCFMLPQPVNDVPMGSRSQIIASALRQRRERMEALVGAAKAREAKCITTWDYPAHEAIVRQVLKTKPDLLITASHRHGRLARWLLANTDWELIRQCPCPVWFVRSPEIAPKPDILVAVDPFHAHDKPAALDERLVHAASVIAAQVDGRVKLAHACQIPDSARSVRSLLLTRANQTVRDLAARHGVPGEDCEVKAGKPEDIIPAIERRDRADLLVIGAVSRSVDTHPVIGNTAERVIDRVTCDLLVIKPPSVAVTRATKALRPSTMRDVSGFRHKRAPMHHMR